MNKIISYIKSILSGTSDASSKRVVGVLGALSIISIVFIDIFTGKAPEEYVLNALISLEMIAFGGVAVENVGNAIGKYRTLIKPDVKPDVKIEDTQSIGIPKAEL
jgi:hypothetical protein